MNKQKWLECTDIQKMLKQITDDRKLRLFACAVARQSWHLLEDERSRNVVIVAERFADGEATREELKIAKYAALDVYSAPNSAPNSAAWAAAAAWSTARSSASFAACYDANITKQDKCNLLREIINPHHEPILYPKVSIEIAQNIYKTQDFTGTPILADSLEEHGIMDQELLNHLRTHTHVRGCWAIDETRMAGMH